MWLCGCTTAILLGHVQNGPLSASGVPPGISTSEVCTSLTRVNQTHLLCDMKSRCQGFGLETGLGGRSIYKFTIRFFMVDIWCPK